MAEQSTGQGLPVAQVREYLTGLQARITHQLRPVLRGRGRQLRPAHMREAAARAP